MGTFTLGPRVFIDYADLMKAGLLTTAVGRSIRFSWPRRRRISKRSGSGFAATFVTNS